MHKLKIYTNSDSDNYIEKLAHASGFDAPEFLVGMLTYRCPEDPTIIIQCAVLTGLADYMDIPIEFEYVPTKTNESNTKSALLDLIYMLVNTSSNPDASKYGNILKLLINKSYED